MSVNTKMTAIANEIRTLSGTTDPMGLDAMATNLNGANVEVGDQSDLLDQAIAALEGKAAGGGGGDSVETCTLNVAFMDGVMTYYYELNYTTVDANGRITPAYVRGASKMTDLQVVCGTVFNVYCMDTIQAYTAENADLIRRAGDNNVMYSANCDQGETMNVEITLMNAGPA